MQIVRKVYSLLPPRRRWQLVLVFGATLLSGMVATLGVASIMPFMAVVANPEVITDNRWLAWAYDGLRFQSSDQFLFALGLLTLLIIASSNGISAATSWLLARFTHAVNYDLSRQLLGKYLSQSYSFYLGRNSSHLAKNVLAEVNAVVNGIIAPIIQLIAKSIVAVFILALLFYVDAVLALIVALVLSVLYGGVYLLVRRKQTELGRRKVEANSGRYKAANEAFGGIKDVKVLGRESHFVRAFSIPAYDYARTNASNAIVSQLPKYALETIAFGGILVIVLYLLQTYQDLGQVLPIVSLYAFAAYRLMPSFQVVLSSLTKLRFNLAPLEDLYVDLVGERLEQGLEAVLPAHRTGSEADAKEGVIPFTREIHLEGVSFTYPEAETAALRDVDLTIEKNTTVGLIGQTGAGKTTLVDILLGLYRPTEGHVAVDGQPLTDLDLIRWRRRIGYVPQQIFLADADVTRNIAFGIPENEIDVRAVECAARTAHIHEFVLTLPRAYETRVGERGVRLSGGQRQRIGIARALYHNPEVLVMDEATSALDNLTEDAVMEAIRELAGKKTIVLIAHRLTTVEDCDLIVLLEDGKVAATGTYQVLLQESASFRALVAGHPASVPVGLVLE